MPAGIQVERNVAYGEDSLQTMDIYHPSNTRNAPVMFMVHGGGWDRGDKAADNVVTNKMTYYTGKGYVFVSINYRLAPAVTPPDEVDDVAKALAFAQAHAESWGGDPASFVVIGHSAGANLVSLLAVEPDLAAKDGVRPWKATIPLDSAAYNVVTIMEAPHLALYDPIFGTDKALWTASSPTLQMHEAPAAPMLLVCSSQRANSCTQATGFARKAKGLGGSVQVLPEALSHGSINADLGLPGKYTDSVDAFLRSIGLP